VVSDDRIVVSGLAGAATGLLVCLAWYGAALLFAFPTPTEDQLMGMIALTFCAGVFGSVGVAAYVVITEG
jgi:hypothetical protein